ncbi:MAG: polymorphic toxin-type HINT domain-containing protein [Candidatus Omnitrophota bacterium]
MRNKGFTTMEMMVVAAIGAGLLAIVFSIFMLLNTSLTKGFSSIDLVEKSRIAMEQIQRYLEKSSPEKITIQNCLGNECSGQKLTFQVPVVTNDAISGTVFNYYGNPKWGAFWTKANGNFATRENAYFTFYAGAEGTADEGKLIIKVWHTETTGGTPGCFLAGTPILMADGSRKPIEEIKVGDEVLAYNEETATTQKDKVTKLFVHEDIEGYLIVNGNLKVTPEHRFYSQEKWIEIGSLKVGDKLLDYKGQTQEITSIEKVKEKTTVYNFEVEPSHTYFAGGFLVHNVKLYESELADPPGSTKLFRELFSPAIAYADTTTVIDDKKTIVDHIDNIEFDGGTNNQTIVIEATFVVDDPQQGENEKIYKTTISPRN